MNLFVFQRTAVTEQGNVIPNAEITVYPAGTTGDVDLFDDAAGTPKGNPFNAGPTDGEADGFIQFYVAFGQYDIAVNGTVLWENQTIGRPELNDITALSYLNTAALVDGQQFKRKEFWPGTGVGGVDLYWKADEPVANHTGGTIIDPAKISELNTTTKTFGTYFTPDTVSGNTGCFVVSDESQITIDQFGAIGDGSSCTESATAYFGSLSETTESEFIFSPGRRYLLQNFQMTAKPVTFKGHGATLIVSGADAVIYPESVENSAGDVVTQDFYGITWDYQSNHIALVIDQTWDANYKYGPKIKDCLFNFPSSLLTVDTVIYLKGLWAFEISDNIFNGNYDKTNYSIIKCDFDTLLASSVMNGIICKNRFVNVNEPIIIPDRASQGGGRCEGVRVYQNEFIRNDTCIFSRQVLSLQVTDNLFSQVSTGVNCADSHSIIRDNVFEGLEVAGIDIYDTAETIIENNNYGGNVFKLATSAAVPIRVNLTANNNVRAINFGANSFYGVNGEQTATAVKFVGDFVARGLDFSGSTFEWFANAYSSDATSDKIIGYFEDVSLFSVTNKYADITKFRQVGKADYKRVFDGNTGATIDATSADIISARDTVTVTDISPDQNGKTITIVNNATGTKTISRTGNIILAGGVDYVMPIRAVLVLAHVETIWYEVSRAEPAF